jgi:hypothetical protein
MERTPIDPYASIRKIQQAFALVVMLLTRLDMALDHIDTLGRAFRSDDADLALMASNRLGQVWSDAYSAILVLEILSKCSETNARAALAHLHDKARVPLGLARSSISRLSMRTRRRSAELRATWVPRT